MKRLIVVMVLAGGLGAVAFGALHNNKKSYKQAVEKKVEKKKKCCRSVCPFS